MSYYISKNKIGEKLAKEASMINLHCKDIETSWVTNSSMQGRHFILICGAGVRGGPAAGVQGKPKRFWHFKVVPDMYFCG